MGYDALGALYGVKVVSNDMIAPRKVAFIGRSEHMTATAPKGLTRQWWQDGPQFVGMLDMDTGKMTMFDDAEVQEIRVNSNTLDEFVEMMKQ
jgi:hypothetical protein